MRKVSSEKGWVTGCIDFTVKTPKAIVYFLSIKTDQLARSRAEISAAVITQK